MPSKKTKSKQTTQNNTSSQGTNTFKKPKQNDNQNKDEC